MTATVHPTMPNTSVTIEPVHVVITTAYDSGSRHHVHMIENPDLGLLPGLTNSWADRLSAGETGTVVVNLSVDQDRDQVHLYVNTDALEGPDEVLAEAIEALMLCRNAMASMSGGKQVQLNRD